jgi:hypothetical protein
MSAQSTRSQASVSGWDAGAAKPPIVMPGGATPRSANTGHVDVVYLPYLPLRERTGVGDWELIPRSELQTADCLDEGAEELARGLGQMYVLPREAKTSAGAFARPSDRRIEDEVRDMQRIADLRRACVTAVLDPNPDPTLSDEQKDWNAGHWMLSTENATVVGHGINRDGYTGTNIGSRFPSLHIGVSVLDQPDKLNGQRGEVLPPADLRIPTWAANDSMPSSPALCGSRSDAGTTRLGGWVERSTGSRWRR